jgi:hypothetical protein
MAGHVGSDEDYLGYGVHDEAWQARGVQQRGQLNVELDWLLKSGSTRLNLGGHG